MPKAISFIQQAFCRTTIVALIIALLFPISGFTRRQADSKSWEKDEIDGYKIERKRKLEGLKGASASALDEDSTDLGGLIEFGQVTVGQINTEQISLELPLTIKPVKQKGEVHYLVFHDTKLNGVPFTVSDYREPFKLPNKEPLMLPRKIQLSMKFSDVGKALLPNLIDPQKGLEAEGTILIFGKFRKFLVYHKRAVPIEFRLSQANPIKDYSLLKLLLGQMN